MYPSFKISFTNSWDGKPFECKIGFVFENEKKHVFFVTALTGSGKGGGGGGVSMTEALRTLGTSNFLDPSRPWLSKMAERVGRLLDLQLVDS